MSKKQIVSYANPEIRNIAYSQDADGYKKTDDDDCNHLSIEIYENYFTLETKRWACTPNELRKLADKLEQLLQENFAPYSYVDWDGEEPEKIESNTPI